MLRRTTNIRGFSLVELLVSLVIVMVLLGLLVPLLTRARAISHTTLCANNLRQIGIAWQAYLQDHERFPQFKAVGGSYSWNYGGVRFVGESRRPVVDSRRPINSYVASDEQSEATRLGQLFECPADAGVYVADQTRNGYGESVFGGLSCYLWWGTSYMANPALMDSTYAGIDRKERPLNVAEIHSTPSRLLLVGDPIWYYATKDRVPNEPQYDASWHLERWGGNMAAFDGSVRFTIFGPSGTGDYDLWPRPRGMHTNPPSSFR